MPEGHIMARQAQWFRELRGEVVTLHSMQQGSFRDQLGVSRTTRLDWCYSRGKHLLVGFSGGVVLNVHLGMYGTFDWHEPEGPVTPFAALDRPLRMRMTYDTGWLDLYNPARCRLVEADEVEVLHASLGPDPLNLLDDISATADAILSSERELGALVMDQSLIAGIGNIYRAECLFRTRLDPLKPGRATTMEELRGLWEDVQQVMRVGVREYAIRTTEVADTVALPGEPWWLKDYYVYRRRGRPCRLCGTKVVRVDLEGRGLYYCPQCQQR